MRKILTLVAVAALAGCGGGGGGSTAPAPANNPPTTTPTQPQSNYVKPTFLISIPARGKSSKSRQPKYVSSGTASVTVTLTADSVGITPGTIAGNPATTTVTPPCSPCTVAGPPSPPGTDSFTVVTNDGSANALNAGQLNSVPITAGQSNSETITLGAIPATLSISGVPSGGGALTAGTQGQHATISVVAVDAAGVTIPTGNTPAVFYVDATGTPLNVTVSDPDTTQHGSCVVPTGTSTCTSGATSITLSGPDSNGVLAYDGLAEIPVTLTASASTATNGTASFQPALNAPAFNASSPADFPSGVALTSSAEIDLFALSGIGSTGTESFTESGWTNSPYGHALSIIGTPACTTIATVSAGSNDTTNGTPFTATVVGGPSAGTCTATIGDGLSANGTDGSATLTVTYTTSSIGASSKHRHQ